MTNHGRKAFILTIGSFCIFTQVSIAAPLSADVSYSARASDNIGLDQEEESDVEHRVSVGLDKSINEGVYAASLSGNVDFVAYQNNTFDSEPEANISADLVYQIIPSQFSWSAQNNLNQVFNDTEESANPDNITTRNIFRTGPSYVVPLSRQDALITSAEYSRTDYSDSTEESERYTIDFGYSRQINSILAGGFNGSRQIVDYDGGNDLYRNELSGSLRYSDGKKSASASLGKSWLKGKVLSGSAETDSITWSLGLAYELTRRSSIAFNASSDLTDRDSGYDLDFNNVDVSTDRGNAVEVRAYEVDYNHSFSDGSAMSSSVFYNRTEYVVFSVEDETTGASIEYSRALADKLGFSTNFRYTNEEFAFSSDEYDTISISASLDYQWYRNLYLEGAVGRKDRSADLNRNEYDENWISIGIRYIPDLAF